MTDVFVFKEVDFAGFYIVHAAYDGDGAVVNHFRQDGAGLCEFIHYIVYVVGGNGVDECVAVGHLETGYGRVDDGRFDFAKQGGEVAQLNAVAGAFDRAAFGVAEDEDNFGAGNFAGKFHGTHDVFVEDISGNSDTENIAEALVEDQLGRGTRVHAAENHGKRVLAGFGFIDLFEQIAVQFEVIDKPVVAAAQQFEGQSGGDVILHFFGERTHKAISLE